MYILLAIINNRIEIKLHTHTECVGAVIQHRTEGGRGDLTGSPKLLDGERWANKLLQMINMGHEATCFRMCFNLLCNCFEHCQPHFCCSLESLILLSISVSFTVVVSAGPLCLIDTLYWISQIRHDATARSKTRRSRARSKTRRSRRCRRSRRII